MWYFTNKLPVLSIGTKKPTFSFFKYEQYQIVSIYWSMVSIVISDLIPLISILQLSVSTAIALIAILQFQWLSIKCNKPHISILIGGFDQQVGSCRWRWWDASLAIVLRVFLRVFFQPWSYTSGWDSVTMGMGSNYGLQPVIKGGKSLKIPEVNGDKKKRWKHHRTKGLSCLGVPKTSSSKMIKVVSWISSLSFKLHCDDPLVNGPFHIFRDIFHIEVQLGWFRLGLCIGLWKFLGA